MKKMLIILVALLAVLFGVLMVVAQNSSQTLYEDAPHVDYNQLGDDVVGTNLYYFYQETCVHCNNIKPDIADFFYNKPEDIDFYLVDGADAANKGIWFQGDSADFVEPTGKFTDYTDVQILGTPTLVEIKDGQITQFLVGEDAIPSYLAGLNA